jgi:hypothetical protein
MGSLTHPLNTHNQAALARRERLEGLQRTRSGRTGRSLSASCIIRDSIDEGHETRPAAMERSPALRRGLLTVFGVLLTIAGVIWTLQGLGYIGGSVMTGVTLWAVVGPIVAVIGLVMAVTGLRQRAVS